MNNNYFGNSFMFDEVRNASLDEAVKYIVPPNRCVLLLDQANGIMRVKSNNGINVIMNSYKEFDESDQIKQMLNANNNVPSNSPQQYVTMDTFNEKMSQLTEMLQKITNGGT